jgi:membrane protein YdbS with pleckstrin-like domain
MAPAAPDPVAPATEQVLWEGGPSMKAMVAEIVRTALYAVAVPVGAALVFDPALGLLAGLGREAHALVAQHRDTIKLVVTLAVVALVLLRLAKLGVGIVRLRSQRYRVTNQRLVLESGVLSKRIGEIDMRTVDDVELRQRPLPRMLGIGDIAIVSTDRQAARVVLLGVEDPRALRELIRSSAYGATRGQLFTRST